MTKTFDFTGVPQEDIDKLTSDLQRTIDYIVSGSRARAIAYDQRKKDLKTWSKDFIDQLKVFGLTVCHTNYYAWEIHVNRCHINIYYELEQDMQTNNDFYVTVVDYTKLKAEDPHCTLFKCKTVAEVLDTLKTRSNWEPKRVTV